MANQVGMADGHRGSGWRIAGWGVAVGLLMLPFISMRFTSEVNWTASDFVFAGVLIGSVGVTLELAVRMTRNHAYRAGVGLVLAAAFLLIWINGAVGIIGSEDNPLNLLYGGVLAIALAGAVGAGFQPHGMAREMTAAAVAQGLMAVVAIVAASNEPPGPAGLVMLNGFFVALFLGAAWLFRKAAREQA